jgi:hypothetical protein
MSANNHYQQNNLAQHKLVHENHQYPTSTAQMVSNSLNLDNDYYYDPDTQIHYHSNCNNTQSGPPASPANLHQINSPDDFTTIFRINIIGLINNQAPPTETLTHHRFKPIIIA